MKKVLIVLILLATLVGCGSAVTRDNATDNGTLQLYSQIVTLPDGRSVTCIYSGLGDISCDWGNAK